MIEGETILCFAPEKWGHIWRNRHQIMSRLARRNHVLFVEPRPYLRDVLPLGRALKLAWADLRSPRVTQIKEYGDLWVYHPPAYAPISGRFPLSLLFRALREAHLKRTARQLFGAQAPILWLYRPSMSDLVGRLGEKLVIYHIVDEYAAYEAEFTSVYSSSRRDSVERREQALLQMADLVIVASNSLLERKRAHNTNTHWVPNAVDFASFAAVARERPPLPSDLAGLPAPIIGYVGAINEKLDYELLYQVAGDLRGGSLILVGPVDLRLDFEGLHKLQSLPNVRLLGLKPVAEVPLYVYACQVCLMPYKLNEWTAHINPLKLFEYLAEGKPVVSTTIPAVRGYEQVIRVAADAPSFCREVRLALQERDEGQAEQRMALAAQNTWDDRVEKISQLIHLTLEQKKG